MWSSAAQQAASALIGWLLIAPQLLFVQALFASRSVDEVGDSTREAHSQCGQKRTRSYVCDPDNILSDDQGSSKLALYFIWTYCFKHILKLL